MKIKSAFCITVAAALLSCTGLYAQESMKFFVSAQGGAAFSLNENFQAYFAKNEVGQLFSAEGSFAVGTYFNGRYGARLSFEYSGNKGAANYQETFVFSPFQFKSGIGFADVIVNAGDISEPKVCNCRFFAGIGYACSFDFHQDASTPHWWSELNPGPNHSFGIRTGMIIEFVIPGNVGFFFEPCIELFADKYNGVAPKDQTTGQNLGFPFDCKINNSFGIAYHF